MESFWKGSFAPNVHKSIGTIRFVPLAEMTNRDWQWLDYDHIRTVARNRIASSIMRGKLRGFFQVMLTEKAAKNEYFWPAEPDDIRQFAEDGNTDFGNVPEIDNEAAAVAAVERLRFSIRLTSLRSLILILEALREYMNEENHDDTEQANLEELDKEAVEMLMSSIMMWEMNLEEAEHLLDDIPESDEADEVRDWINDQLDRIFSARQQIAAGRGLTPS